MPNIPARNAQIILLLIILMLVVFIFNVNAAKQPITTGATAVAQLLMPDGAVYTGELYQGLLHGQGELVWPDGERYSGSFVRGVYSGQGVLSYASGDEYRGEFIAGEMTGQGELSGADGTRYIGEFLRGQFNGPGEFVNAEGARYIATFTEGDLSGPGEYFGKDGEHYQGDFQHWSFAGAGTLTEKSGVYKGQFEQGLYHGYGQYRYAEDSEEPGKVLAGKWRWGEFEEPTKEADKKNLSIAIEKALYQQAGLLKSTLSQLKASDPESINLYFVGVAGYSRQDVFRNELEFIRQQFDRNYATKGRSLLLINSNETLAHTPLATTYSIEQALQAVAGKMDPEKDILFVYLSSHGSAQHEFSIVQEGLSLPDLTAERLGDIVKALPVKWRVIVVSACYSGGFIPPLESPTTLVMTAASEDRRSFGCSDTAEMTYFGRAYFKEALPSAGSFEAAFSSSVALIEKWEKELGEDVVHSLPQINVGKEIETYLPRWWRQIKTVAPSEVSADEVN